MKKILLFGIVISALIMGIMISQNVVAQPIHTVDLASAPTKSNFGGSTGINDVTSTATCPDNTIIIGGVLQEFNIQNGNDSEYTLTTTINPTDNSVDIRITLQTSNVEGYIRAQAVCLDFAPFLQVVGGMFVPTSSVSLALAFGYINAPWIGLGMVGLAAGTYYFKARKKSKN